MTLEQQRLEKRNATRSPSIQARTDDTNKGKSLFVALSPVAARADTDEPTTRFAAKGSRGIALAVNLSGSTSTVRALSPIPFEDRAALALPIVRFQIPAVIVDSLLHSSSRDSVLAGNVIAYRLKECHWSTRHLRGPELKKVAGRFGASRVSTTRESRRARQGGGGGDWGGKNWPFARFLRRAKK